MSLQRLQANNKWDKTSENVLNSWVKQLEELSTSVSAINSTLGQISQSVSAQIVAAFSGKVGLQTYVESTFTPGISFGGGTTGITYSAQTGVYTRIGRLVHVEIVILLTSKGSSTGAALVTGLPLTVAATAPLSLTVSALTAGVGDTFMQANAVGASTTINLQDIGAGSAASITDVDFTNSTLIRVQGVYRTSA